MAITKKQKEVFDYINQYINHHGYAPTQKEIKEHFELKSYGSVQRYIKYLTDEGYLTSDWNARRGISIAPEVKSIPETHCIPLLGLVAAGNPIEAIENADDFIDVPKQMIKSHQRYFALKVRGDSMIEAGILQDDLLVCEQQNSCSQGEIVVAVIDGEATVKKYKKHPTHIELIPANASYSPIMVNQGDFHLAGIVVGLLRSYR